MKRKLTIILFGASFLIAILGEAYLLNMPEPDTFSIIGIGIVVLLTGYLLFDSIWELISSGGKNIKHIWEERKLQDLEKENARYTELLNVQKATYAALKKSNLKMQEELLDLANRISALENAYYKGIKTIIQEQNKALNKYSKEHTKELLEAINNITSNIANKEEEAELEIIPLYDDPNAALTPDEIAKLFNEYGK